MIIVLMTFIESNKVIFEYEELNHDYFFIFF